MKNRTSYKRALKPSFVVLLPLAAMHIAFDALLIPGHEWDTGEIPEHNVISVHGIYEEPVSYTHLGKTAYTCRYLCNCLGACCAILDVPFWT